MTQRRLLALFTVSAVLAGSGSLAAQGGESDMAQPKPGPQHKLLEKLQGDWTAATKMMGPVVQETKGAKSAKVVAGGFFVMTKDTGEVMGMPFEGHMTLGYDQGKNKYVASWVDNFGSYMTQAEGTYDEKTKTLTLLTSMPDMTGTMRKSRWATEFKSDDHHIFRMYQSDEDGKETQIMEIGYSRKK